MYLEDSLAKNKTTSETPSGVPARLSGINFIVSSLHDCFFDKSVILALYLFKAVKVHPQVRW